MKEERLIEIAEDLGWRAEKSLNDDGVSWIFQRYSSAGQDFFFEVEAEESDDVWEVIDGIDAFVKDFDISYNAYIWLDDSGHGANGAPYDMRDVYNDMEECYIEAEKLLEALRECDEND